MVEPGHLEPRLPADLAEPCASAAVAALVEVEQVAHAREVAREPGVGAGDRGVQVRIARDVEIRPAVAAHVSDRRACIPAGCGDPCRARPLRERALAAVPEQLDAGRRRDDQVGAAVVVQVRRDAPFAAHREACVRPRGHVHEPALDVPEKGAAREPSALLPERCVALRVGVDDEEVEPAVVVVVQPAEPAAHHRRRVEGHAEAKGALAEREADLGGDVLQLCAGEFGRSRPGCGRPGGRERQARHDRGQARAVTAQSSGSRCRAGSRSAGRSRPA